MLIYKPALHGAENSGFFSKSFHARRQSHATLLHGGLCGRMRPWDRDGRSHGLPLGFGVAGFSLRHWNRGWCVRHFETMICFQPLPRVDLKQGLGAHVPDTAGGGTQVPCRARPQRVQSSSIAMNPPTEAVSGQGSQPHPPAADRMAGWVRGLWEGDCSWGVCDAVPARIIPLAIHRCRFSL
ncbi:MAG: hypothetical protein RLZZ165_1842 [Bacteroidota bacterium]|jgi:hypothetical protein